MDPTDTNEINEQFNNPPQQQGEELSHSDKMIGVFTEPAKTFEQIAKFPPRNKDWVIPLIILFILIGITRTVSMMNEEVFLEAKQEQINKIEKMVEDDTLTREQGDKAIEGIDDQMEMMRGPLGWVINIVSVLIFGFIFFFIIAGIYFLFIKLLLKGNGTYASTLVANGLTGYITIVQVILAAILTMALGSVFQDTSLASLMGSDKSTIEGWLFAKVDPVTIWAYIVLSIGFAKMFKSDSTGKYYALVFGLWIIGGLLIFLLAQAVPFLSFLNM
jgi:Yip1 domain